jgi:hypothetical protein
MRDFDELINAEEKRKINIYGQILRKPKNYNN